MPPDSRPVPLSPSKGKAREETRWRTGWWDFYPLVEQAQKPLEWSESSIIFSAHATRPEITARHFSSSKQFAIESPPPIVAAPGSFNPPAFISVAPGERSLFVFYPGTGGEGIGCIYRRGVRLDSWKTYGWWKFAPGTHPVAASWLGSHRTASIPDLSGSASRLPLRGPRTPISHPTLLYVTSNNYVNLCYARYYAPSVDVVSRPLDEGTASLNQKNEPNKPPLTQCIQAAIGLAYDETSILVVSRSRRLPDASVQEPQSTTLNLDLPIDMSQPAPSRGRSSDCEQWGEEDVINLCEVQLEYNGAVMSLRSKPLPPVQNSIPNLIKLYLIPSLKNTTTSKFPDANALPTFYMVTTHLSFGDYMSTPKSEIISYSLTRQMQSQGADSSGSFWKVQQEAKRCFHPEVVSFVSPFTFEIGSHSLYVGTINTAGSIPRKGKDKQAEIGLIRVLNLHDLKEDEGWYSSSILSPTDKLGHDLPLISAVSPNGAIVATTAPWVSLTSIHLLPKRKVTKTASSIPYYSIALATAVLQERSTSDITHVLSSASTPLNVISDILYHTIQLLDKNENGVSFSRTGSFLGVVIELYRYESLNKSRILNDIEYRREKAKHNYMEEEREMLEMRAQILFDILSLKAFNEAFEECREEDGKADLNSAWQLIELSEFIVHFVENLMRECVLWCDPISEKGETSTPTLNSPTLLSLAHPFAYKNVAKAVKYVSKLKTYIESLPAGTERVNVGKNILIDLVDSSGVDFDALDTLLGEMSNGITMVKPDDSRSSLASCQPVPSMYPLLNKVVQKINDSNVLNKSMLFIKPKDLVDGTSPLYWSGGKEQEEDVVSKRPLTKKESESTCVRCGGISKLGKDLFNPDVSIKWRMWERLQMPRCICYGHCLTTTHVISN
ncbi:hypothetical protein AMATHDRAFT_562 [Amanita thiersii Skay4041]|uniref:Mediator complex subunit 16 n=1 Tax=Amanita thiersii Skay4041 TaxID=703135 RepID=A0A2A9NVY4_9AGAR|nr:hypothetical protein AMATHDRAFT_562 [Amanita thiersii Skay4041]